MKLLLKIFALFALTLAWTLATAAPAAAAYSNGYTYRRTITIDHTLVGATDSTNFPVLVSGTYSYLKTTGNGGNVQNANGYDIIFTSDAAGSSTLSFEQETYSASTGTVNFWVKVATVSHTTDTVISIFYGNAGISTFQGGSHGAAWDTNFVSVWHLPDGATLSALDSKNSNNGTINGATAGTGKIDGASATNGTSQDITMPSVAGLNSFTALTVEAWGYLTAYDATDGSSLVDKNVAEPTPADPYEEYILFVSKTGAIIWGLSTTSPGSRVLLTAANTFSTGVWTHLVGTWDGSTMKLYKNGAVDANTASFSGTTGSNGNPVRLGSLSLAGFFDGWNGVLDEIRISSSARSADWILAEYNNQSNPTTFYAIGAETTSGGFQSLSLMGVGK